jgi:hypothetical protein
MAENTITDHLGTQQSTLSPSEPVFDHGNGWVKYSFVRPTEDPQIVVEEVFWQEAEPLMQPPAEA